MPHTRSLLGISGGRLRPLEPPVDDPQISIRLRITRPCTPAALGCEMPTLSLMPRCAFAICALSVRMRLGGTNALAKRFLEVRGTMMFFQQIAKSFVPPILESSSPDLAPADLVRRNLPARI